MYYTDEMRVTVYAVLYAHSVARCIIIYIYIEMYDTHEIFYTVYAVVDMYTVTM